MRSSERGSGPSPAEALFLVVVIACTYAGPILAAEGGSANGSQGQLKVQSTLVIESGTTFRTLKMLEAGEEFQGYGYLSPSKIFVASTSSRFGDASSDLEVIDLVDGHATLLYNLGATGESEFAVSPDGTWVALNWIKGIWVFSARDVLADLAADRYDKRGFEKRLRLIVEGEPCWLLKWVDLRHLSYCTSGAGYGCSEKQIALPGETTTRDLPQAPTKVAPQGPPH